MLWQGKSPRPSEIFITAMLVSLSIALHFFKIPYPLMTALKFDLVGIPLVIIAYLSLRYFFVSLPVVWLGITAISQDWIGASMKILAEATTVLPLALAISGRIERKIYVGIGIVASIVSRAITMMIANYFVLPRWALLVGWVSTLEEGYKLVFVTMPYIVSFNVIMAALVSLVGYLSIKILRKAGFMP